MKRQGAVGNKRKDSRSDMSDFWHKYMDSYGEMVVSYKDRGFDSAMERQDRA